MVIIDSSEVIEIELVIGEVVVLEKDVNEVMVFI